MLDTLKVSYNKLAAQYKGYEDLIERLDRAIDILVKDTIYDISKKDNNTYLIYKGGKLIYTVTLGDNKKWSCNCPDAKNSICKHKMAVYLLIGLERNGYGKADSKNNDLQELIAMLEKSNQHKATWSWYNEYWITLERKGN